MSDDDEPLTPHEREEGAKAIREWFHRYFSDANSELPYESAEGGFQLIKPDRLDSPSNILRDHFGDEYPSDLIDEVAYEIDDSPTWFRTTDVFPDSHDDADDGDDGEDD